MCIVALLAVYRALLLIVFICSVGLAGSQVALPLKRALHAF